MESKRNLLWQNYSLKENTYLNEGNRIITDVTRTLLSGGTFLFVLTGTLLGSRILDFPISFKVLLIVSWILLFISFCFGIRQLIIDSTFLGEWARRHGEALAIIGKVGLNEEEAIVMATEKLASGNFTSNMWPFWIQIILMAIAFIIQIIVVSCALFVRQKYIG